jgi:hypothetical protein
MQCKAYSRRNQQQCRNPAMRGVGVCRMHGGKTPRGAGSVHFKDGRYSTCLPTRLAAHYEDAAHDPELLELRDNIATVDARIIDLLQRVDTGESGQLWRQAQAAMARFRREQVRGNLEAMQQVLARIEQLITDGAADYAAWQEVMDLIEQRRKLVESEQRRLTMAHESLTSEQAMLLLTQVVATIQRHVTDRQVLGAIAQDLQGLVHHRNGHAPDDTDRLGVFIGDGTC